MMDTTFEETSLSTIEGSAPQDEESSGFWGWMESDWWFEDVLGDISEGIGGGIEAVGEGTGEGISETGKGTGRGVLAGVIITTLGLLGLGAYALSKV